MFFSGDAGTLLVIVVLAQRSRDAENGSRAIATMRPRIEVSSPMRVYCIGDTVTDKLLVYQVRFCVQDDNGILYVSFAVYGTNSAVLTEGSASELRMLGKILIENS